MISLFGADHGGAHDPDPSREERRTAYFAQMVLSDEDREHLRASGFIRVRSPSSAARVYHLPFDGGLIGVYEHGALVRLLCGHPVVALAPTDALVALKLAIQVDEPRFLSDVNAFALDSASPPMLRALAALAPHLPFEM
jgi:hypothetical protein